MRIDFGYDFDIEIADFQAASIRKRISHADSRLDFDIEFVLDVDKLVEKYTELAHRSCTEVAKLTSPVLVIYPGVADPYLGYGFAAVFAGPPHCYSLQTLAWIPHQP